MSAGRRAGLLDLPHVQDRGPERSTPYHRACTVDRPALAMPAVTGRAERGSSSVGPEERTPEAGPEAGHARVVWRAYRALPAAWRKALWQREVEGRSAAEVAASLGMTDAQAGRALANSYAGLRRGVALAHPEAGTDEACADLIDTYRFSPPAHLPASEIRLLREHGRHCDRCLGLIRDLFVIEHSLRATLAEAELGPAADAYLASRPSPPRRRGPGVEVLRPDLRVRPSLAVFSAASLGAAAMAMVMSTPAIVPTTQVPEGARAADVLSSGQTLAPVARSAPRAMQLGLEPASITISAVALDAAAGAEVPGPRARDEKSEDSVSPDSPSGPTGPATPSTPTTPGTPVNEPPSQQPPRDGVVVHGEVDTDEVSVSVDPGPTGPIEVEVEVPDSLPPVAPPDVDPGELLP